MSELRDFAQREHGRYHTSSLAPLSNERLTEIAGIIFWRWYFAEGHSKRIKGKLWLFRPSIRVSALYDFFVMLFGEPLK